MTPSERPLVGSLLGRLRQGVNLIQVVVGPRQVGKTTAVHQVAARWRGPSHYASADLPSPPTAEWVSAQWEVARALVPRRGQVLLVLDEVQKVPRWSEVVKALFDEDRRAGRRLRVVLLGSAALGVRTGVTESLAGRFELHHAPQWSFPEMRDGFGWTLDRWLVHGGYPGAAPLVRTPTRWIEYVRNSLIETVLSRDVLALARVNKPALLRQVFALACEAPAEIVAFNKMLGQLQDAGNTVTLADYLRLLGSAFLVSGIERWTPGRLRTRASSPKLVVWSNAFVTAWSGMAPKAFRGDPVRWGRLVENAVGGALLTAAATGRLRVYYFRDGPDEVDYVVEVGARTWALEVKSGRPRAARGLELFARKFPEVKRLVIGSGGIPLEQFFAHPADHFLR